LSADRRAILAALRRSAGPSPHPGAHPPPLLPSRWEDFAAALTAAGGVAHGPLATRELAPAVADLAQKCAARGPGEGILTDAATAARLGAGPWQALPEQTPPATAANVAVHIAQGRLGVAECGAVALLGRAASQRALLFLARHLILVLDEASLVPDLHTGFAQLPADAWGQHHVTWISGPSKTADIEQTLVLGAHGPLSTHVVGVQPGREGQEGRRESRPSAAESSSPS